MTYNLIQVMKSIYIVKWEAYRELKLSTWQLSCQKRTPRPDTVVYELFRSANVIRKKYTDII